MSTIIVDPGHGGSAAIGKSSPDGVRGPSGTLEKDVTLAIAERCVDHLGDTAALTRTGDQNMSLASRAEKARLAGAGIFLSIHANLGPPGARGAEIYVHERGNAQSQQLASRLHAALVPPGGAPVRAANLAVLTPEHHASDTAACLLEIDFLSDPEGEADLTDPMRVDAIGQQLAAQLLEHLADRGQSPDPRASEPGSTYGGRGRTGPRMPRHAPGTHERYGRGSSRRAASPTAAPLAAIAPDYTATSLPQAIALFIEWLRDRVSFTVGVPDTSFFPHSAICRLDVYSGGTYQGHGTGFYIAPNRILTAGHVLAGMDAVEVSLGRNGDKDLGGFSVGNNNGEFVVHPNYVAGSQDFDLAVLKVNDSAPNGQFFEHLEELRVSPGSGVIVCGYAADDADPTRQHIDVDTIRELFDETFTYALETRPGTSGSPVWYVDGQALVIVGVHVSGFDQQTNQGCRLTDAKVAWIQSI